jgi:hypothetical protein
MDLSAPVGFIHKESITMHGHTILKKKTVHIDCTVYVCVLYDYYSNTDCFPVLLSPIDLSNGSTVHYRSRASVISSD